MITSVNDTRLSPEKIWEIQSWILRGVYTNEYPSSVCETSAAIQQTRDGTQRVLFWWNTIEDISNHLWWTVALVKSELTEALEMCRAWATIETWEWFSAIQQLIRHFNSSKDDFSSIYVTTRNCQERKTITGESIKWWRAIFTMFNRLKEFKFFWFAPWYIMPWWKVELLDIRVLHRDLYAVVQSLQSSRIYVSSEKVASIIYDMLDQYMIKEKELQISINSTPEEANISGINWIYSPDYSELWQKNSLFFYPGVNNTISSRSINTFLSDTTPIKTIQVNLLNKDEVMVQELAERNWFWFTGIIPTKGKIYWFWTKVNKELSFSEPLYMAEKWGKVPDFQYNIYKHLIP